MSYNPAIKNSDTAIYLKGREDLDGSIRFIYDPVDGHNEIQKRVSGVWQNTEFQIAYGTLFLGHNLAISAAGDQLVTENVDGTKQHLYARTLFSGEEGSEELRVVHLDPASYHSPILADDSGEFTGTSISYTVPPLPFSFFNQRFYLKIGSTDATAGVTINIHRGPDNTYPKRFSQIYPASTFSSKTDTITAADSPDNPGTVRFTLGTNIELWEGQEITNSGFTVNTDYNITDGLITSTGELSGNRWFEISSINYGTDESGSFFTREIVIDISDFYDKHDGEYSTFEYTSTATFSLKANAAVAFPWIYSDTYQAYHDEVLITKEWTQYDSTNQQDWYISHENRKIYVANASQTKGSTFTGDAAHWNELSPFIFSWETLPSTQNLLIPENHQMIVHGTFTMEGDLTIEGTLSLIH